MQLPELGTRWSHNLGPGPDPGASCHGFQAQGRGFFLLCWISLLCPRKCSSSCDFTSSHPSASTIYPLTPSITWSSHTRPPSLTQSPAPLSITTGTRPPAPLHLPTHSPSCHPQHDLGSPSHPSKFLADFSLSLKPWPPPTSLTRDPRPPTAPSPCCLLPPDVGGPSSHTAAIWWGRCGAWHVTRLGTSRDHVSLASVTLPMSGAGRCPHPTQLTQHTVAETHTPTAAQEHAGSGPAAPTAQCQRAPPHMHMLVRQ